jgi:hypothetical protein
VPESARSPFSYTVLRVIPRVERGEFINAGVVLHCPERRFLGARVGLDRARLAALAPDCDADEIEAQLEAIRRIAAGDRDAGPIAALGATERYHWLASPSSTIVGRSEGHTGLTASPAATLDHLFRLLVMTPGARYPRDESWHGLTPLAALPVLERRMIARIRRLGFAAGDAVALDDGPIELSFADGSVVLADAADDWTLRFYGSAWADPLAGVADGEERARLARRGRWFAVDVTAEDPWRALLNAPIDQAAPTWNDLLELTGLLIRVGPAVLELQVRAGELHAEVRAG